MNSKLLLQPSKSLVSIERRLFMKKTLSLGALAMLTGCGRQPKARLGRSP